jgi:hypothetical protein
MNAVFFLTTRLFLRSVTCPERTLLLRIARWLHLLFLCLRALHLCISVFMYLYICAFCIYAFLHLRCE